MFIINHLQKKNLGKIGLYIIYLLLELRTIQ